MSVTDHDEPEWFRKFKAEQEEKIRAMREENLRLQGRLEQAQTQRPKYDENLPTTEREWGFAAYGLDAAAQLARRLSDIGGEDLSQEDRELVSRVSEAHRNAATARSGLWQEYNREQQQREQERRERFERLTRDLSVSQEDEDYSIAEAAFKGGAEIDHIGRALFERRKALHEALGEGDGRRATSLAHQAGGAIEEGEAGGEPRLSPTGEQRTLEDDIARRARDRAPSDQKVFSDIWSDPARALAGP